MLMAEKKLQYKEVPRAVGYVIKTLWKISPGYVITSFIIQFKDKLVPFITLFIAADVTTQLPDLIAHPDHFPAVLWLLVLIVIVDLTDRGVDLMLRGYEQKAESVINVKLREQFYAAYARLPYHLYEDKEVMDAFQYADDFMSRFSRFGLNQIAQALASMLELIVAIVAMASVAWFMPFAFIIFVPFLMRSVMRLNRQQARMYQENRGTHRRMWAIEGLFYPRRIKETRLYGVVGYLLGERRKYSLKVQERDLKITLTRDRMRFWQGVQMQGASLFASIVAIWRIAYQGAPLGSYVLATQLANRIGNSVQALFTQISDFDQDLYGFAEYRYITVTLQPPHHKLPAALAQPDIRLHDITFTYPQTTAPVLKNITLDIPFGHSLAIVGENGAGKTTLTRLLLGLYQPQKGAVEIAGTPLPELDESSWLSRIGVLLQDFGMDEDMTIREAVWLGDVTKQKDGNSVMEVLKEVELDDVISAQPNGLDTYLGKWIEKESGIELSGGQLQRLAIARALYRNPNILILDEPTSAIDANAEERIFSRLMRSRKGKTTIFISHRFSTVRRAEHIAFIERGQLQEYGTHEELMAKNGKYAKMFKTQAEGYL
jgi:ATP-binding cassette subfamily B protein/ATP-binding cassette subfamily C protein